MLLRGLAKVVIIALAANQILTIAFAFFARQIDAGLSAETISLFSFATCGLVSLWLQADARSAYRAARAKGFITPGRGTQAPQIPQIAADCPRRWLVVLHIELNPAADGKGA